MGLHSGGDILEYGDIPKFEIMGEWNTVGWQLESWVYILGCPVCSDYYQSWSYTGKVPGKWNVVWKYDWLQICYILYYTRGWHSIQGWHIGSDILEGWHTGGVTYWILERWHTGSDILEGWHTRSDILEGWDTVGCAEKAALSLILLSRGIERMDCGLSRQL